MPSTLCPTDLPPAAAPARSAFGKRLAACFIQLLESVRRSKPDPRRVARLAHIAARHPALLRWLLVIASESPRIRRALLARAAQELDAEPGLSEAVAALEELADAALLHAVTETLFRQNGLEPPAPTQRSGRGARFRLSELAERLQARDAAMLAT